MAAGSKGTSGRQGRQPDRTECIAEGVVLYMYNTDGELIMNV